MDKAEKLCEELNVELGFIFSQYLYTQCFLRCFILPRLAGSFGLTLLGEGNSMFCSLMESHILPKMTDMI